MPMATAPHPRIVNSITRRSQPATSTGASPERLGSFRTLKVPHRTAATSGTAIAAIHRTVPLVECQAATPSPMSAPISRAKRSARFQPAVSGGFIRGLRFEPTRRRSCAPLQRQRERFEPAQTPSQPERAFHDDSTHPETRRCDQSCRRNRPPITGNTGAHMCRYGRVVRTWDNG
jgi:hypothetical protein